MDRYFSSFGEKLRRLLCSPGFAVVVAVLFRVAIFYRAVEGMRAGFVQDNLPFGFETGKVAQAIAEGRGFSSPLRMVQTGPTAWLSPVYPYILAGIFKLFGVFTYKSYLVSRAMDISLAAFTCWPIYAIGTKAFGRRIGIASTWLWAFLPSAVYHPSIWVWDTALAGLWMALLVLATLHIRRSKRMVSWVGYGALWACGAMINASLLSVLPFLALWAIWPLRPQLGRAAKLSLAASAVFVVGISPWTIRNYVTFHKLIPFRSNFALELWLGNNPDVPDTWAPFLHPDSDPKEASKYARMTEIPYMEEKQREALRFMREHPGDVARFTFRRFEANWLGTWEAPTDAWAESSAFERLMLAENCVLSLLSLVGALFAFRNRQEAALPFALILLVFPLVFYFTHPAGRYRFPIDSVLMMLTVYALAHVLSGLGQRIASLARSTEPAAPTPN
jgi:hypothetical protein